MPTGVALRDAREQLFEAAERILRAIGPSALTSRAVTAEAGVAKGVMHRYFADFDTFLVELIIDRTSRLDIQAGALLDAAGTRTVADNLTDALMELFGPVALGIVSLVIFRDDLRVQLRQAGLVGIPMLTEATAMIAAYLLAERSLGRVVTGADVGTLAPTLVGAAHMLFVSRKNMPPDRDTVRKVVVAVVMP